MSPGHGRSGIDSKELNILRNKNNIVNGQIRSVGIALLLVAAAVTGTAGTAAGLKYTEVGEPTVKATVEGPNVVTPGETTTLPVVLSNTGRSVTTLDGRPAAFAQAVRSQSLRPGAALSTSLTVRSGDTPLTVRTGQQAVGVVEPDTTRRSPVQVEVDESAPAGTYRLPVEVTYRYLNNLLIDSDETIKTYRTKTVQRRITVRVERSTRLEIVSTTPDGVSEGADGTITATVRNAGTGVASDAALRIHATDWLTPRERSASVGDLAPNETATATFRVGVGDVSPGAHAVGFSLRYDDRNGVVSETPVRTGAVPIGEGPQFTVSAAAESLYVDSTGAVSLTVTNTGDTAAHDVRVHLRESPPLVPVSGSASLGDLDPGESATARLRIEVSDRALAGTYPISIAVERDDTFGDPVLTDPLSAGVAVGPERTVETGGAGSVPAGSTTTVTFEVTNTGEAPMRDAVVRLNADSPFETDDDTAYVGTLAPDESATVRFTLSVGGAATPKAYTLDATVAFDNGFDRRVVTDTEPTEIQVEAGGGGPIAALLDLFGL